MMAARIPSTVLIVDDDPALRRTLEMRLREEGYAVATAASGEQALARIAVEVPALLITDVRMTGMDGLELFRRVQRDHPLLPVLILTAHGNIPDAVDATRRGAAGYLTKPYEASALLQTVKRAMSHASSLAPPLEPDDWSGQMVTRNAAMLSLLSEAKHVAVTDAAVLICGQTGTGKELLAQAIHDASPRREAPFVAVNCGAIPENLLESELFGHVKGAFTGAVKDHRGLIPSAHGGTIFLDEIGDMPLALQVKLLRVIQEREARPVGAVRGVAVDVRFVSATHRDLEAEMAAGRFREDLYYRLNVVRFQLPPLAERRDDIPLLAQHFLSALAEKYRKPVRGFTAEALQRLACAAWPGNVRELFNVVERCVALCPDAMVAAALVERALCGRRDDLESFDAARARAERVYLVQLLKMTAGNVSEAARIAKRNRSDFYSLLHRHHLEPSMFKG